MLDQKIWKPIDNSSPGYEGQSRNEKIKSRNKLYGKGRWTMGWLYGNLVLEYEEVCWVYEDGYFNYFSSRPELLDHLCKIASEVYDDDVSNVASGQDYSKKGSVRTHIQDIAIRRCLVRSGRSFDGDSLVQIRDAEGKSAVSKALSPGQVPFHRIEMITVPANIQEIKAKQWWLPGSVEDFYQLNKRIFLKS